MSLTSFVVPGVRTKPHAEAVYLRFGADIINWMQEEQSSIDKARVKAQLRSPGLVLPATASGQLPGEWSVYEDPGTAGNLLIGQSLYMHGTTQTLIDSDGTVIVLASGAYEPRSLTAPMTIGLACPGDSTWRTLVVRAGVTRYAPGVLTFASASAAIVGTGTDLTRFGAATTNGLPIGTKIRVDTADNASLAGDYQLATVTSATAGTLTTNAPANGTVPFSIIGSFQLLAPSSNADKDIYQYAVPEFELVTRTVSPAAGDYMLADVWYDGVTLKVIDKRRSAVASFRDATHTAGPPSLVPVHAANATSPYLTLSQQQLLMVSTTNEMGDCCVMRGYGAASEDRIYFVSIYTSGSDNTGFYSYDPTTGAGSPLGAGTTTLKGTILSPGAETHPHACRVEADLLAASDMWICVYEDGSGGIDMKTSTNFGASWSAGTSIWTSSDGADTITEPYILQLRNGRIIVYAIFYDDSAGTRNIRAIYSDDMGTTWSGGTSGTLIITTGATAVTCVAAAQDPVSGEVYFGVCADGALTVTCFRGSETGTSSALSTVSATVELMVNASATIDDCDLWVAPSGHVVAVYSEKLAGASGTLDLRYAVLGKTAPTYETGALKLLATEHIQRLTDATAHSASLDAADRVRPSIIQTAWGTIYLMYVIPGDTIQLKPMRYISQPIGLLSWG